MSTSIPWWSVDLSSVKVEDFREVISSNFPNEGNLTSKLSEQLKSFLNVKHAILTTSGTTALFLGLKALGVDSHSRVAVPNLTFIATANAVSLTGAKVVLVDVDPITLTISIESLKQAHKDSPLDLIIPVHVSGRSAFNGELVDWAIQNDIKVVEDAAEAFGSRDPVHDALLGTIGEVGAFSFSPNKLITSGQGGLVVTNDDDLAGKIRRLKDQGRPERGTGGDDNHDTLGFNFKFTDLQAALLLAQLPLIKNRLEHLKDVYKFYESTLSDFSQFRLGYFNVGKNEIPLWPELICVNRARVEEILTQNGIGFRKIWKPISTQNPYLSEGSFKNSIELSRSTLWLPSSFFLNTDKLQYIVSILQNRA